MADRWVLNRAGIVNVYQYGHETLHFVDGRLLLRGINGSGKSTAMNMLLPFLLDGDTRRIDAAGEQAGVLKSWMLSGRDDPQPIGYLWIEFARGDEHLTCGCGIKASRSSDTVSTWWFVTSRRPDVDLDLVEGRHPLSLEALRATLGADPVYRHDQRGAYRAEVRARLFGGADIDQHVRLLHVVRNPRVGDRIDVELPGHLHDALPQLSEAALDDAAQPLDDLEEHRRNVEDLTRTAATLDALGVVYAGYARSELRRRAGDARSLVEEVDRAQKEKRAADDAAAQAAEKLDRATEEVDRLAGEETRLRRELEALRESPAYKEGKELNHLRDHVASLAAAIDRAVEQVGRRVEATSGSRRALVEAARAAGQDRVTLTAHLQELAACVVTAGLPLGVPDAPALEVERLDESRTGDPGVDEPIDDLDPTALQRGLEEVRSAVVHRQGDVAELKETLGAVEAAEGRLAEAHRAWETAEAEAEAKQDQFVAARRALDEAVAAWRIGLAAWVARLNEHRLTHGMATAAAPDFQVELAARRDEVVTALDGIAEDAVERHQRQQAGLEARRATEQTAADEMAAQVEDLDRRVLPAPPALSWQRDGRGAVLAELIDFHESVPSAQRAGLEAAMEAAGILGAEVTAEGTLELAEGGLVVRAGRPASAPLSRLLTVTVPEEQAARIDPAAVAGLLDTISTDATILEDAQETTVVTVDGRFRVGVLRGRHAKVDAEHIGLTARRAALERQRADARLQWQRALDVLIRTDDELAAGRERIDDARSLRAALPPAVPVAQAVIGAEMAEVEAARTRRVQIERRSDRDRADEVHAEAVDKSRRTAANLGLPTSPEELHRVEDSLGASAPLTRRVDDQLTTLVRAIAQWRSAGRGWQRAMDDERQAGDALAAARAEHEPFAARLATLEDSIGVAYEEIVAVVTHCATELGRTTDGLQIARLTELDQKGAVTSAGTRAQEQGRRHHDAAARAVAVLPRLRRTLQVPGLLAAAVGSSTTAAVAPGTAAPDPAPATLGALLAPVAESPEGVRGLASAILVHVPSPGQTEVGAESVRQSLRQRRDSLGAGWDAEDRQADESLPLSVEVNGPEGQMPLPEAAALVAARLRDLTSLLSAEQDDALRNLLHGIAAREVAEKLHAARDLVTLMNRRLDTVTTTHGIGVSLRWRRRDDLDAGLVAMIELLAKPPDLRTVEQDQALREALSDHLDEARRDDPEAPYRDLIGRVLDYRSWHEMTLVLRRPGRSDERLNRRTALSEGEKKIVSYLPLFAAVAASCDSLAESAPDAPRFVLLDDAFAKVSEDNHPKLFGLLVELDLDFIATSERLWGTHATVPGLAITEVLRDADLGVIVLEHSRWDGTSRTEQPLRA